jgi:dihydroorotate dehydrogenase electron transfer subunit
MRLLDAELTASREILPGQWLQSYQAPWLASGVRAGQFVHVRTPDYSGLVLRRPFSINTVDRGTGVITIHFRVTGKGTEWMARARPGDRLEMLGPLGRPFEVDSRSRHLLLVAGGLGMAGVRALADELLESGRQVTLLFGAASATEVYPSSLLPDEIEYVVATDDGSLGQRGYVTDMVPAYEAWADQCFACGPEPMLAALARLASGRDARLGVARLGRKTGRTTRPAALGTPQARRKAWLQVSMEQNMGCAVGACLGCVVIGVDGPQRVCREGPVFAAEEIVWAETA